MIRAHGPRSGATCHLSSTLEPRRSYLHGAVFSFPPDDTSLYVLRFVVWFFLSPLVPSFSVQPPGGAIRGIGQGIGPGVTHGGYMTIIIALAHEDGVTVGCDQLATIGDDLFKDDQKKWSVNGKFLSVGFSGSPYLNDWMSELAVGYTDPLLFCDMLRNHFRADNYWPPEVGKEGQLPMWDLNLLLTNGRRVWEAGKALYPIEHSVGIPAAVGSGYSFALGAMHAIKRDLEHHPRLNSVTDAQLYEVVVLEGLLAAIHYDTKCGGEPWVGLVKSS